MKIVRAAGPAKLACQPWNRRGHVDDCDDQSIIHIFNVSITHSREHRGGKERMFIAECQAQRRKGRKGMGVGREVVCVCVGGGGGGGGYASLDAGIKQSWRS